MNEADTPNNGGFFEPIDSANSSEPQQISCPFDSVCKSENTIIEILPLLTPKQNSDDQTEVTSDTQQQDWVAEPDSEKQAIVNSEFKQMLKLNEELRSANNSLYDKVEELTAFLSESEKALQLQTKRLCITESMLNQQNQEIAAAQDQIQSLFQQLETAVQTAQRQEMQLESYKAQLEINQQRLAQLERECAALQSNYNEQSHQLLQSENACRELRTRLMRQQRQTLQFKAALEKCLDTPFPSYDSIDDPANDLTVGKQPKYSKQNKPLTPNAQPIQPWSSESESLTDDPLGSVVHSQHYHGGDGLSEVDTSGLEPQDCNVPNQPFTEDTLELDSAPPIAISEVAPIEASNLEEQLDSVIQMFFVATSASQPTPQTEATSAETVWETYATPLVDDEEQTATVTRTEENKDLWSDMPPSIPLELSQTASPQEPDRECITNANSPSPLIHPERPSKGRKSLAAVELPHFI